jgi:hypothetical protein
MTPRDLLRNRVSVAAGFLALLLAGALLGVYLTTEDQGPAGSPVQLGPGDGTDGGLIEKGVIRLWDEVGNLQVEISARSFSVEDPRELQEIDQVEAERPQVAFFQPGDDGTVVKTATLESSSATVDRDRAEVRLRGRTIVVIEPESSSPVRFTTDTPVTVSLGSLQSEEELVATASGPVRLSTGKLDLMGTGLLVDLRERLATLARDVSVIAEIEEAGGLPGLGSDLITITATGPLVLRQHGGPEGLTPSITFERDVKVTGDAGSSLRCQYLEITSLPKRSRFVPESLVASGDLRLQIAGLGTIDGEELRARRDAEGSWRTEVHGVPGERLTTSLVLGDTLGIESGDQGELFFTCAGTMTFNRDPSGRGLLVFHDDVRGSRHLADRPEPVTEWTVERELTVTLATAQDVGIRIDRITATGRVTVRDRGSSLEEATYEILRARANGRLEVIMDEAARIERLNLVDEGELEIDGVAFQDPRQEAPEEPPEETPDEPPTLTNLRARAERLELFLGADGARVITAEGNAKVQELSDDVPGPLRQLEGQGIVLQIPAAPEEGLRPPPRLLVTSGDTPASYQDYTSRPPLTVSGTSIETDDLETVTVTGSPARGTSGSDTMTAPVLVFALEARQVSTPEGTLEIHLTREGAEPVKAWGSSVREEVRPGPGEGVERRLWILEGSPARVSAIDEQATLQLEAPLLEVDPEKGRESVSCPDGGVLTICRQRQARTEKVLIQTAGPIHFRQQGITAGGRVHVHIERGKVPFEVWADQLRGELTRVELPATEPGEEPKTRLELTTVVASGRVEIQAAEEGARGGARHKARGDELSWHLASGQAKLTAPLHPPVHYWDANRQLHMIAASVTLDDERGTIQALRPAATQEPWR